MLTAIPGYCPAACARFQFKVKVCIVDADHIGSLARASRKGAVCVLLALLGEEVLEQAADHAASVIGIHLRPNFAQLLPSPEMSYKLIRNS